MRRQLMQGGGQVLFRHVQSGQFMSQVAGVRHGFLNQAVDARGILCLLLGLLPGQLKFQAFAHESDA